MTNPASGGAGQQRQAMGGLLTIKPGLAINLNYIVWVQKDRNGATLYLSAPGPDRTNAVFIDDPAVLNALQSIGFV